MKFSIVIEPELSKGKKYFTYFILTAFCLPVLFVVFTQQLVYLWISVISIIVFAIYNRLKNNKFSLSTMIQKDKHIRFSEKGIEIINKQTQEFYNWNKLSDVQFSIDGSKGLPISNNFESSGLQNNVSFKYDNTNHTIDFYIAKEVDYRNLLEFIKEFKAREKQKS
ncbi:MAG: hypothetical protein ACO3EE_12070 [Flavobacteriales bacterium]